MTIKSNLTTLCYIENGDQYLMMHRIKKKNDLNHDKWIGVGGHFEDGESPEECLLREVREETGLTLVSWQFRGIVTFCDGNGLTEYMMLYTADKYTGEMIEGDACDEGELVWVTKDTIADLPIWEGDKIFLKLLAEDAPFFSLKLVYDGTGKLCQAIHDGKPILSEGSK
ncbi:MAG: 8-oxo-dGTP diphosphatase [Lachnospiraceae bacterium]|nr:8-oxo-dGTP diphosphatase [Lachnospiraceae bacterium]